MRIYPGSLVLAFSTCLALLASCGSADRQTQDSGQAAAPKIAAAHPRPTAAPVAASVSHTPANAAVMRGLAAKRAAPTAELPPLPFGDFGQKAARASTDNWINGSAFQ